MRTYQNLHSYCITLPATLTRFPRTMRLLEFSPLCFALSATIISSTFLTLLSPWGCMTWISCLKRSSLISAAGDISHGTFFKEHLSCVDSSRNFLVIVVAATTLASSPLLVTIFPLVFFGYPNPLLTRFKELDRTLASTVRLTLSRYRTNRQHIVSSENGLVIHGVQWNGIFSPVWTNFLKFLEQDLHERIVHDWVGAVWIQKQLTKSYFKHSPWNISSACAHSDMNQSLWFNPERMPGFLIKQQRTTQNCSKQIFNIYYWIIVLLFCSFLAIECSV